MYCIVVRGLSRGQLTCRKIHEHWTCGFWATVTRKGLPYAMGPLSCLSVTLVYCGQTLLMVQR